MNTNSTTWRLAFLQLTHAQQCARVVRLIKAGWPELSVASMTSWEIADIRRATSDHTRAVSDYNASQLDEIAQ